MLLRLITVISLFKFMLLLIAGTNPEVALYRSVLVFLILFTVVYLTMFFLNIIQQDTNSKPSPSTVSEGNKSQASEDGGE